MLECILHIYMYAHFRFLDLVSCGINTSREAGIQSVSSVDGEEGFKIDYEYEMNEAGQRVVLGKGSFGTVYSGVDMVTRKKMAIKEIPTAEGTDTGYVHTYVGFKNSRGWV